MPGEVPVSAPLQMCHDHDENPVSAVEAQVGQPAFGEVGDQPQYYKAGPSAAMTSGYPLQQAELPPSYEDTINERCDKRNSTED